jgi:hypothetical protein
LHIQIASSINGIQSGNTEYIKADERFSSLIVDLSKLRSTVKNKMSNREKSAKDKKGTAIEVGDPVYARFRGGRHEGEVSIHLIPEARS